jgi:hypothetical protein
MMGHRSDGHGQRFYAFNLDDHVPADHLLRGIDRCLDLEICAATSRRSIAIRGAPRPIRDQWCGC